MNRVLDIILVLVVCAIAALYCGLFFGGYEGIGDGNDYAGLARNIVTGKGFLLGHVYPLGLVFNPDVPQPNNIWAPGYPVYLAIWFFLFGISDGAALAASVFAVWLFVIACYLLGRAFGGTWMARMAAALAGLSQVILYTAIEGTPEILAAATLAFSVLLLIGKPRIWNIIISGILFGVTILIRYQVVIVAFPLIWVFFHHDRKLIWPWLGAVVFALAPWLIRNMIVLGNPIFTLQSYGEFAKGMGRFDDYYYAYRSFTPMPLWYVLTNFPLDLARKFLGGLIFFASAFPMKLNFLGLVPLFFALMKVWQVELRERRIILFAFYSTILLILISSLDGHHDRHLLPIQGFLIVTMLIGFKYLITELGAIKYRIAVVLLGAILFLPARTPFLEMRLDIIANLARAVKPGYAILAQRVEPDAVVVSDVSDAVWWYGERNSIWIPATYGDLRFLITNETCDYIFLIDQAGFLNSLSDEQLSDFAGLVEPVDPFLGPGTLYRVASDGGVPDSYALR
jgi:4-amino-4-deoxy-L-arabinose transferase-like glycosyltransferase